MSSDDEGGNTSSDDQELADFLEAELLGSGKPNEDENKEDDVTSADNAKVEKENTEQDNGHDVDVQRATGSKRATIYSGSLGTLPTELFPYILKYLSPEDLSACSTVCHYLKFACGEESLWRRLYCLRWGALRSKPRGLTWKQLYFDHDRADMHEFVRNTPEEFREYYIHMQASKRSQAPRPHQVDDDLVVVESKLAQEISAWRRGKGVPEVYAGSHTCSGKACVFHQIGDVFLCEGTGRAHVCDEQCAETVLDAENSLLVCAISGRCFDRLLSPEEEQAVQKTEAEAATAAEEGEPLMADGRLGRAFCEGYNCDDEEELQRVIGRF